MRRLMILTLVFACSTPTWAADPDTVAQIRQQINALQQQLEALENAPAPKRNVTQIGASRARNRAVTGMVVGAAVWRLASTDVTLAQLREDFVAVHVRHLEIEKDQKRI